MNIVFDFENIATAEFGFGLDQEPERSFIQIPIDIEIQIALKKMVQETIKKLKKSSEDPEKYSPSEKYASIEYVTLPLEDIMVSNLKNLHNATNLCEGSFNQDYINDCFGYFCTLIDDKNHKLTAIRRATQFKGVLKKRLIRFLDDTLKIVPDNIFKLDNDFDFIINNSTIHILRPSGLEFTAQLKEEIIKAVQANINIISREISFIDFSNVITYAKKHSRAARYIASIKSQNTENIDQNKLILFCQTANVELTENNGKVIVDEKNILQFLEVLDRRRFSIDITNNDDPELYRASSRSKI